MRGALANGVTDVGLREIALHSILYCGIPAGGEALRMLDAILAEDGTPPVSPASAGLARTG